MLHVMVGYPDREASRRILALAREEALNNGHQPVAAERVTQESIFAARREVMAVHLAESVEEYIVELVEAGRTPHRYGDDLASWIRWGASPGGRSPSSGGHKHWPGLPVVISSRRRMCRISHLMPCAIGCCSVSRPRQTASPRITVSSNC